VHHHPRASFFLSWDRSGKSPRQSAKSVLYLD
jgi:hypothetical protein